MDAFLSKPSENLNIFELANISNTLFDQRSSVHQEAWFSGGDNLKHTDIATYKLNLPRGRISE